MSNYYLVTPTHMRRTTPVIAGVLMTTALLFGACGTPAPSDETAQFPAGTEVMALYQDGPSWMDATVTYVTTAEEYDVTYTNGEEAKKLPITSITGRPDGTYVSVNPDDQIIVPLNDVWTTVISRGYNGNEVFYTTADGTEDSVMLPNVLKPATARTAEAAE